jgi:biotin carboxylase
VRPGEPGGGTRVTSDGGVLVVVNSGDQAYREYVLRAAARRHRLWLVQPEEVSWQAPWLAGHTRADTTDPAAIVSAVRRLGATGLFCYDEMRVEQAAEAAEALGLPGPAPQAVAACRDKARTRDLLAAAGLGVTSVAVPDQQAAAAAAASIGYPVIVKPRNQGASRGVRLVIRPEELPGAVTAALAETWPGVPVPACPVLIEEYLEGPEVSVDSIIHDGTVTPVVIARKRIGFPPAFEETGHDVAAADPLFDDLAFLSVLTRCHAALGLRTGVTHAELRLTRAGPRIVEVNARLGGDLIPYAGLLASGADLCGAAADVATGRHTIPRRRRRRHAGIRFLYPPADCRIRAVHIGTVPAQVRVARPLARRGEVLRLPPHGFTERFAVLIAAGADPVEVDAALTLAAAAVTIDADVVCPWPR